MNKKSLLFILLDLVFLGVFNLVFFTIGGVQHVPSVWIAYGFIHFAYLTILVTPLLIRKNSSASVFGMSIYSVSFTYFFAEFIIGLFFIFVASDSYKASLIIQVIIAGIYAVFLLANLIANEQTEDSEVKRKEEVAYIKNTATELKALIGEVSDKMAYKEIEKAYDVVHSSPIKSSAKVKEIEKKIYCTVSALQEAVKHGDVEQIVIIAQEIVKLTEERNRSLRLLN